MKKENLKYLLELVDDNQPGIKEEIITQLVNYGKDLEMDLEEFSYLLTTKRREIIDPILEKNRRKKLTEDWIKLKFINDFYPKLEYALRLIAQYQLGYKAFDKTVHLIDSLAMEFNAYNPLGDEVDLAAFLFKQKGISGNRIDYYNPLNSNIFYAIKEKRGIPITLCSLYMLVGSRLNMKIEGCGFPGHFLSKINVDGLIVLVDCFKSGKLIYNEDLDAMKGISREVLHSIINRKVPAEDIIRRVLNNLINAYNRRKETLNEELFTQLLTAHL